MIFLNRLVPVGLLIFYVLAGSQSLRTKEGMCKVCQCEQLNLGTNQSLKIDCSRLARNDVENLLGNGTGENGQTWSVPYEAYVGSGIIKIILDSNVIQRLSPLPPLRLVPRSITRDNATETSTPKDTGTAGDSLDAATASTSTPPSQASPESSPLVEISFRSNHMKRIDPGAFTAFSKTIWSIDLSKNDLTFDALIPSAFRGEFSSQRYEPLVCLKQLSLARNSLHSLDPDLFEHVSSTLEDLNLQGNPLGRAFDTPTEHALSTLHNLKTLNLADVGITSYPEGLAHALISLENLRLDGNKFTVVPASLSAATSSLRYLNLNRNPLEILNASSFVNLPGRVSAWRKLETLDISAMPELMYVLRGSFENLSGLQKLRCAFNQKLLHFDEEAFRRMSDEETEEERWKGFQLKELDLQGDGLQWLSPNVVPWNELDTADLQSNPWFCDCSLKSLANSIRVFIKTKAPNMSTGLLCEVPHHLKGVNFLTTYSDDPNGTSTDEGWSTKPGGSAAHLWSDCDHKASRMVMTSRGALASALGAVGVTLIVSLLLVTILIYVVRRSIRVERMNLPGQVRYVRAPPTKDEEDEQVIMDLRCPPKDLVPTRTSVVLDSRALGTEYRWPRR